MARRPHVTQAVPRNFKQRGDGLDAVKVDPRLFLGSQGREGLFPEMGAGVDKRRKGLDNPKLMNSGTNCPRGDTLL